jgi:hypothetical protein
MSKAKDTTSMGIKLRKWWGFDKTTYNRKTGHYHVACSQCEAIVINGVACHEKGCPNAK